MRFASRVQEAVGCFDRDETSPAVRWSGLQTIQRRCRQQGPSIRCFRLSAPRTHLSLSRGSSPADSRNTPSTGERGRVWKRYSNVSLGRGVHSRKKNRAAARDDGRVEIPYRSVEARDPLGHARTGPCGLRFKSGGRSKNSRRKPPSSSSVSFESRWTRSSTAGPPIMRGRCVRSMSSPRQWARV